MNINVRKFIIAPAVKINSGEDPVERGDVETIVLVQCPRTLDILWMEYEFGVRGNKPAKLFTARESGKVKFSYSSRKPVWTLVEKMIHNGY